jgi:hypothetical protein
MKTFHLFVLFVAGPGVRDTQVLLIQTFVLELLSELSLRCGRVCSYK